VTAATKFLKNIVDFRHEVHQFEQGLNTQMELLLDYEKSHSLNDKIIDHMSKHQQVFNVDDLRRVVDESQIQLGYNTGRLNELQ